jgi:hypothetical protein
MPDSKLRIAEKSFSAIRGVCRRRAAECRPDSPLLFRDKPGMTVGEIPGPIRNDG